LKFKRKPLIPKLGGDQMAQLTNSRLGSVRTLPKVVLFRREVQQHNAVGKYELRCASGRVLRTGYLDRDVQRCSRMLTRLAELGVGRYTYDSIADAAGFGCQANPRADVRGAVRRIQAFVPEALKAGVVDFELLVPIEWDK
jgi:hypothetical protein